jgi:hypothetical protein
VENQGWFLLAAKKSTELLYRESRFTDDGSERPFCNLLVIGDDQSPVRRILMSKDHVASSLPIELVASVPKSTHDLPTRSDGQPRHPYTSTTSSEIGGGSGSSCASRLSRYPAMASRT